MDPVLLKHILILGLVIPTTFAGYHVMAGVGSGGEGFSAPRLGFSLGDFTLGEDHGLGDLGLLERDLYQWRVGTWIKPASTPRGCSRR